MAWTSKNKNIPVAAQQPHSTLKSGLIGKNVTSTLISFTPLELFGAAARCNNLIYVDPSRPTAESDAVARLLEIHVNDHAVDFAIDASVDGLKDYVKSYFAGTVGGGLAYLLMIREGYVWKGHFEDLGAKAPNTTRSPDFVFADSTGEIALTEAKGSRSASTSAFDKTIADGYIGQVEPQLGFNLGGVTPTHGFCIGSYLKSTSRAELRIHHTDVASGMPSSADLSEGRESKLARIQQLNYVDAFYLCQAREAAEAISPLVPRERERGYPREQHFLQFNWKNTTWLTSFHCCRESIFEDDPAGFLDSYLMHNLIWELDHSNERSVSTNWQHFAIQKDIALKVLSHFGQRDGLSTRSEFDELPNWLMQEYLTGLLDKSEEDHSQEGVVFPDGMAFLGRSPRISKLREVRWDPITCDLKVR